MEAYERGAAGMACSIWFTGDSFSSRCVGAAQQLRWLSECYPALLAVQLGLQMPYNDVHCIFLLVPTCPNSTYSMLCHVLQSQCEFHWFHGKGVLASEARHVHVWLSAATTLQRSSSKEGHCVILTWILWGSWNLSFLPNGSIIS